MVSKHAHETAPTEFTEADGIRFAYRRFGAPGAVPVLFNQHFQGTLDHWDPAVTDGLAATREVILFDNVQGSNDVVIPTANSYVLQQNLPDGKLIIFPDADHGSSYRYPDLFVGYAVTYPR